MGALEKPELPNEQVKGSWVGTLGASTVEIHLIVLPRGEVTAAALAEMEWRPWAAFGVALAVKAVAIPVILWFMLNRVAIRHEVETVVPLKLAFPIALGLALLAYWLT